MGIGRVRLMDEREGRIRKRCEMLRVLIEGPRLEFTPRRGHHKFTSIK